MSIIGINGKIGSGKDTIGSIIQYVVCLHKNTLAEHQKDFAYFQEAPVSNSLQSGWEIKKFAGKLKQIASLLTGIPIEAFEDQEFKKQYMPEEWNTDFTEVEDKYAGRMTYREFLQKLGTEAMRDGLHTNVWVNALFADYKLSEESIVRKTKSGQYYDKKEYPNWIITDMRFPNEMEAVVEKGGITIRVVRPKIESVIDKMRPYSDLVHYGIPMPEQHPSETALDDAEFDYEIVNDGSIEDLIEKVKQILITEKII